LVDDVDFIAEVRRGAADAPDMDPAYELLKLKKKFEIWKREFKVRTGCCGCGVWGEVSGGRGAGDGASC
jgi:hypothetical protein